MLYVGRHGWGWSTGLDGVSCAEGKAEPYTDGTAMLCIALMCPAPLPKKSVSAFGLK